jgi:hypothetical protein
MFEFEPGLNLFPACAAEYFNNDGAIRLRSLPYIDKNRKRVQSDNNMNVMLMPHLVPF